MNSAEQITTERVTELTKTLVSINSETGKEQEIAEWPLKYFKDLGQSGIHRHRLTLGDVAIDECRYKAYHDLFEPLGVTLFLNLVSWDGG